MTADRFLLEYDDERSGTFEPLRFIPKIKRWCWGWLARSGRSSKRATNWFGGSRRRRGIFLGNLALSPQCGFASTMEGNLLSEEEQWAKLRLVSETARRVWS